MTETLTSLARGFGVALDPVNLFYCLLGVSMGTLVGVLPGLGPTATMALLLPATFHLTPVSAIIMLAGICYGATGPKDGYAPLVNTISGMVLAPTVRKDVAYDATRDFTPVALVSTIRIASS